MDSSQNFSHINKKIMEIDAFKLLKLRFPDCNADPDLGRDPDLDPDLTWRLYGNIGRNSGLE